MKKIGTKESLDEFFKGIYSKKSVLLWCEKIKIAMDELNKSTNNTKNTRKNLITTHRDILVRWLAQIDNQGSDSYSIFKSIKSKASNINKAPNNWLISKDAKNKIQNAGKNPVSDIEFEHNPPVKEICKILDMKVHPISNDEINLIKQKTEIKGEIKKFGNYIDQMVYPINSDEILQICLENKYCIMIITKDEHTKLHSKRIINGKETTYKDHGTFEERIEAMENPVFYQVTKKVDLSKKPLNPKE